MSDPLTDPACTRSAPDVPLTATKPQDPAPARDDDLPLRPSAHPGDLGRLGRYRVLKRLGAGGMGAVYLAFDDTLRRRLALKVMLPKYASHPTARHRFLREARTAASVRSPHVVAIHDVDEDGGAPFIAMEYLEGTPLDKYLRQTAGLTVPQVVRIGREAAAGLAAAHAVGLVHRDVKPGNLWLQAPHGRVKLLDFGLAREEHEDDGPTHTGDVVGTPAYMSPEQARGHHVDARTDLFSLGVLLYRLATGKLPFTGPTSMAVLTALAMDDPAPVRSLNPDVPEPLAAIIRRLLEKNPDDRPRSADEVLAALAALDGAFTPGVSRVADAPIAVEAQAEDVWDGIGAPVAGTTEPLGAPPPRKRESPFPWLAAGGAFAAVLIAGLLVVVAVNYQPSKPEPEAPAVKGPTDPPKPPEVPKDDPDRKAAETLRAHGVTLSVRLPNGATRNSVLPSDPLPAERFVVAGIALPAANLPDGFAAEVLVPTAAGLRELNAIGDPAHSFKLPIDCLARLADSPCASALKDLGVEVPLTAAGIDALKRFPNLQWVVADANAADDDGLARLAELPSLNRLKLRNLGAKRKVDPRTVAAIGKKSLLTLDLLGCRLSADEFAGMVAGSPRLYYLRFQHAGSINELMPAVGKLAALANFYASLSGLTDAGLKPLEGLTKLRVLQIDRTQVTTPGVVALKAALPECVIDLDTYNPKLDPERAAAEWALSKSPATVALAGRVWATKATELPTGPLRVTGISLVSSPYVFTATDLDPLAPLTGLTEFATGHSTLTDDDLETLSRFPAAKKFTSLILRSPNFTDNALKYLAGFPALTHLSLPHTKATGSGLAVAHELPELTHLFLDNSQVTDEGLKHLRGLKKLTVLELRLCPNVTDDGIEAIADLPKLTNLGLAGTKIGNKSLEHLARAKQLIPSLVDS